MMNYKESLEKIYSLKQMGMKLGLENIRSFLRFLGNPQLELKTIHVAGSNGKGSTASFIASILKEAGFSVGLFTSPHFVDYSERFRINGSMVEPEFITRFINEYEKAIDDFHITFFEISAAIAFTYFKEKKVDFAVIETGLGGRLDATNTMSPIAEVITTISHEHTNILGESLREIAREKAGIVKRDSKVFVGILPDEALDEISGISTEKKSALFSLTDFIVSGKDFVKMNIDSKNINIYGTGFIGRHQLNNAALAALTLSETLGINDFEVINSGLRNVKTNSGLEGRFEIYNKKPLVIFDSAHNREGVEAFVDAFAVKGKNCRRRKLIFGAMRDKKVEGILILLKEHFDDFYFTTIDFHRAASIEELIEIAEPLGIKGTPLPNPAEFINNFIQLENDDCLAAVGSIYVLGEIKYRLREIRILSRAKA